MAFEQKTWTDRLSEYPTRRQLTKSDGTTEIVDVARLEGTISQEGDAFSAENMNDLEGRIADGFALFNMRYNEETDMVEIYYNGAWHEWKAGNMQTVYLYNLGEEVVAFDVSTAWTAASSYTTKAGTKQSGDVKLYASADNTLSPMGTSDVYDISKYNTLNMLYVQNDTEYTLTADISTYTGEYYVLAVIRRSSSYGNRVQLFLTTSKSSYNSSSNGEAVAEKTYTAATANYTIYVKKVWLE